MKCAEEIVHFKLASRHCFSCKGQSEGSVIAHTHTHTHTRTHTHTHMHAHTHAHAHTHREQENLEATYMRRRFQGLSLEEQRRRQKSTGNNRFVSRRRSSATESRPSTVQLTSNMRKARLIKANPFGLQASSYFL